jgi:hypothetical protein
MIILSIKKFWNNQFLFSNESHLTTNKESKMKSETKLHLFKSAMVAFVILGVCYVYMNLPDRYRMVLVRADRLAAPPGAKQATTTAEQTQSQIQQTTAGKEDDGLLFIRGKVQSIEYNDLGTAKDGFTIVNFTDGKWQVFTGTLSLVQVDRWNTIYYGTANGKNYVKAIKVGKVGK